MSGEPEHRPPRGGPHLLLSPAWMAPAVGFSHVVIPADGRLVFLGGQSGHRPDGTLAGEGLLEQFDQACTNVNEALTAAGARAQHIVSMHIYVTDAADYRARLGPIGALYRKHFGAHYPAMALFEVSGLFDPGAVVELVCTAVVPHSAAGWD
jgi:enamine deaminase RidA (YjgF/YER057c/UK114 family)